MNGPFFRYAVARFAQALETFPTTLAENTGLKSRNVLRKLHEAHKEGKGANIGVNIDVSFENVTSIPRTVVTGHYKWVLWPLQVVKRH